MLPFCFMATLMSTVCGSILSSASKDVTYWWAEYDLMEMFPNIPREEV